MTDGPPRKAWIDDPPRPSNKTPGQWHRECREREERDLDAADWKCEFRAVLGRVHAARGKNGDAAAAIVAALASEDISLAELERIEMIAPIPQTAPPVRPPAVAQRLPSQQAEQEWLREARLAAEAGWRAAFPQIAPLRDPQTLSGEDLAFAMAAAGLTVDVISQRRNEDGQPKFKGDQLDADLFKRGEESARRIWPGH